MDLQTIYDDAIRPALCLLPARMNSPAAVYWMLAIGLQESDFQHRFQLLEDKKGNLLRHPDGSLREGPARGFWGFEQGGGVRGVLFHPRTGELAMKVCIERGLQKPLETRSVWLRLAEDDVLAAAFARLLLWTDGYPLSAIGAVEEGWEMYCARLWRPGKPHRERWTPNCDRAQAFVETML